MGNKQKDKDNKRHTRIVTVNLDEGTHLKLRMLALKSGKDNAAVITQAVELLAAQQGGAA